MIQTNDRKQPKDEVLQSSVKAPLSDTLVFTIRIRKSWGISLESWGYTRTDLNGAFKSSLKTVNPTEVVMVFRKGSQWWNHK